MPTSCTRPRAAPGVLVWPDIFGLRPAFRQMGKRLAESGYAVLVVNPFYRQKHGADSPPSAGLQRPGDARGADGADECPHADRPRAPTPRPSSPGSTASRRWTSKRKIGTTGYCMGGPLVMRTAAARARAHRCGRLLPRRRPGHRQARQPAPADPEDEGAVPDRHRRERRRRSEPDAKTRCATAFAAAHLPAEIEVYTGTMHGWCPPDSQVYNQEQAEKAWARLLVLFKAALV